MKKGPVNKKLPSKSTRKSGSPAKGNGIQVLATVTSVSWGIIIVLCFLLVMLLVLSSTDTLLSQLDVRNIWPLPNFEGIVDNASKRANGLLLPKNATLELLPILPSSDLDLDMIACEFVRTYNFVAQPMNTISSSIYIMVGFAILGLGLSDLSRKILRGVVFQDTGPEECIHPQLDVYMAARILHAPFWTIAMGSSILFAGCSGAFWHASLTKLSWQLDYTVQWVVPMVFSIFSIVRVVQPFALVSTSKDYKEVKMSCLARIRGPVIDVLSLGAVGAGSYGLYHYAEKDGAFEEYLIAAIVCTFMLPIGLHWYLYRKHCDSRWRLLACGMVFIATGIVLLVMENVGFLCSRNSQQFPTHALWHICSAIGLGCVYGFFRGDQVNPNAHMVLFHRDTVGSQDIESTSDEVEANQQASRQKGSTVRPTNHNLGESGANPQSLHVIVECSDSSECSSTNGSPSWNDGSCELGFSNAADDAHSLAPTLSNGSLTTRQQLLREKLQTKARVLKKKLSKLSPSSRLGRKVHWADEHESHQIVVSVAHLE